MNKYDVLSCWCGSELLEPYSDFYVRCSSCKTLINSPRHEDQYFDVVDEENAYYGKNYWLGHQVNDLGLQSIIDRSRTDLSGRCIYWLKTVLKYIQPGAVTLELGFGTGGLIALLNSLKFESTGIELSAWVVQYVKDIYGVNVCKNTIEQLDCPSKSYDSIILLDVMEHLPQPITSFEAISKLIKDDGVIIIQTPCYRNYNKSYDELQSMDDPFLQMMIDQEHLYLYSEDGIKDILMRNGFDYFYFEPALFPYDMFVIASKRPIKNNKIEDIEKFLMQTSEGRIILALLDLYEKRNLTEEQAILRLKSMEQLEILLKESEKDRSERLEVIEVLNSKLYESEKDREARLEAIQRLEEELKLSEADRGARLEAIHRLEEEIKLSEADRGARLEVIHTLEKHLELSELNRLEELKSRDGNIQQLNYDKEQQMQLNNKLEEMLRVSEESLSSCLNNIVILENDREINTQEIKQLKAEMEKLTLENKLLKEEFNDLQRRVNQNWIIKQILDRNKQK